MRSLRVYVDTSVFGGMFDPEFTDETRIFFQQADAGRFNLVVSQQVENEIAPAPLRVRRFFDSYFPNMEYLAVLPEVRKLADIYLENRVVGEQSRSDAMHVAYATFYKCEGLVSWNFKHIVQPDKSVHFNMINAAYGYSQLFIASPAEVSGHEKI